MVAAQEPLYIGKSAITYTHQKKGKILCDDTSRKT